jgi:hypothetical protein
MMLLLAVRPVVRASPRTGLVLGLVGSAGVVLALPVYALAWLIAGTGLQCDASTGEAAR